MPFQMLASVKKVVISAIVLSTGILFSPLAITPASGRLLARAQAETHRGQNIPGADVRSSCSANESPAGGDHVGVTISGNSEGNGDGEGVDLEKQTRNKRSFLRRHWVMSSTVLAYVMLMTRGMIPVVGSTALEVAPQHNAKMLGKAGEEKISERITIVRRRRSNGEYKSFGRELPFGREDILNLREFKPKQNNSAPSRTTRDVYLVKQPYAPFIGSPIFPFTWGKAETFSPLQIQHWSLMVGDVGDSTENLQLHYVDSKTTGAKIMMGTNIEGWYRDDFSQGLKKEKIGTTSMDNMAVLDAVKSGFRNDEIKQNYDFVRYNCQSAAVSLAGRIVEKEYPGQEVFIPRPHTEDVAMLISGPALVVLHLFHAYYMIIFGYRGLKTGVKGVRQKLRGKGEQEENPSPGDASGQITATTPAAATVTV